MSSVGCGILVLYIQLALINLSNVCIFWSLFTLWRPLVLSVLDYNSKGDRISKKFLHKGLSGLSIINDREFGFLSIKFQFHTVESFKQNWFNCVSV